MFTPAQTQLLIYNLKITPSKYFLDSDQREEEILRFTQFHAEFIFSLVIILFMY